MDGLALTLVARDRRYARIAARIGVSSEALRIRVAFLLGEAANSDVKPVVTRPPYLYPLPPGDPLSWGIITAGTVLEGVPFT
jgi:hypothetical protein